MTQRPQTFFQPACAAIGSGILFVLALPRFSFWPIIFFAYTPLLFSFKKVGYRKGFFYACLFSLAPTFISFDGVTWWAKLGTSLPGYLTPAISLIYAVMFAISIFLKFYLPFRFRNFLGIFGCASVSLLVTRALSSSVWFSEGNMIGQNNQLLQGVAYLGPYGWSLFPLLIIWYLSLSSHSYQKKILITLTSLVTFILLGQCRLAWRSENMRTTRVIGVQPGQFEYPPESPNEYAVRGLIELSQNILLSHPMSEVTIIWPEGAIPPLTNSEFYKTALSAFAMKNHTQLIVNGASTSAENQLPTNSNLSFGKNGVLLSTYDKVYLAPFGERLPWVLTSTPLQRISELTLTGLVPLRPGSRLEPLKMDDGSRVGSVICIEFLYPNLFRQLANNGAQYFVDLANLYVIGKTNTFAGVSPLLRSRAVENGRSMLMVARWGPTIAFNPYGEEIENELSGNESAMWTVPLSSDLTLYTRFGDFCLLPILLLAIGNIAMRRLRILQKVSTPQRFRSA